MILATVLPFQAAPFWGWGGLGGTLIAVVVIAAAIAIAFVAMKAYGFSPPPWVVQMFWIVVVAFVAVLCIRILFSL